MESIIITYTGNNPKIREKFIEATNEILKARKSKLFFTSKTRYWIRNDDVKAEIAWLRALKERNVPLEDISFENRHSLGDETTNDTKLERLNFLKREIKNKEAINTQELEETCKNRFRDKEKDTSNTQKNVLNEEYGYAAMQSKREDEILTLFYEKIGLLEPGELFSNNQIKLDLHNPERLEKSLNAHPEVEVDLLDKVYAVCPNYLSNVKEIIFEARTKKLSNMTREPNADDLISLQYLRQNLAAHPTKNLNKLPTLKDLVNKIDNSNYETVIWDICKKEIDDGCPLDKTSTQDLIKCVYEKIPNPSPALQLYLHLKAHMTFPREDSTLKIYDKCIQNTFNKEAYYSKKITGHIAWRKIEGELRDKIIQKILSNHTGSIEKTFYDSLNEVLQDQNSALTKALQTPRYKLFDTIRSMVYGTKSQTESFSRFKDALHRLRPEESEDKQVSEEKKASESPQNKL